MSVAYLCDAGVGCLECRADRNLSAKLGSVAQVVRQQELGCGGTGWTVSSASVAWGGWVRCITDRRTLGWATVRDVVAPGIDQRCSADGMSC